MNVKAQMEIFGLVILVVILSVVMLIYMSYSVQTLEENPRELLKDYAYNELSTSFVSTLLQTEVKGCQKGVSVEDLIKDCGTYKNIQCSGVRSCDKIHDVLQELLNETVVKWNYAYELTLTYPGEIWETYTDFTHEKDEFHNGGTDQGSTTKFTFGKLGDGLSFRYGSVDPVLPNCGKGVSGRSPPAFFPIPLYRSGSPAILEFGICK